VLPALALLLLGAAPLAAQQVEVGAYAGRISDERGASRDALQLGAAALWAGSGGALRLGGSGALLDGGALLGSAQAAAEVRTPRLGVFAVVLGGEASGAGSDAGYRGAWTALRPRLELSGARWGASVGPELGWAGEGWAERGRGGVLPVGSPPGGAPMQWRGVQGARAEAWGGGGPLSVRGSWAVQQAGTDEWRDLVASAALRQGAFTLSGSAGQRSGAEAELWASGGARYELGAGVALQASAGRYPRDPLLGRAGGRFATVGVSIAPGSAARPRRAVRSAGGVVPLALHAAPGAKVEIVGDFTGWRPEPVREVEAGRYVYPARLAPGRYRFVFRVDGETRLPGGFQSEPDAFGGRSAVVSVEA
jgi:hypothetical protein